MATTLELPFLDTEMSFSGPVEGRARYDLPNWSNSNMNLERHSLRIHDARPIAGSLSLDREGFTLIRNEPGVTAESDMAAEAGLDYLAAVSETLADMTGASLVLPQGPGLLKRANGGGAAAPARFAHMDYTTDAAHKFVEWIEGWKGRPLRHYPRFAVLQTWRSLTPAPCDNTLALCDAASIDEQDCIVFDNCLREPYDTPGHAFESQFGRFRPGQRWYYFSDLSPDEMIVFKGFDSSPGWHAQPFHGSIDLPGTKAAPRVSVETRSFAFFE